jgi:predicted RNA binding protein YcfA (HicA-like mRNA interferase family)
MGNRAYPPLTPSEVIDILKARGFSHRGTVGSHAQYFRPADSERKAAVVTVDLHYKEFDDDLMHSIVRQSGFSVKLLYGSTKHTARKACVKLDPSLWKSSRNFHIIDRYCNQEKSLSSPLEEKLPTNQLQQSVKRMSFRCCVYEQKPGLFAAECIDLDLMVKARNISKAKRELRDAIVGYVRVALETGEKDKLIPRPSPLAHRFRYYFLKLKSSRQGEALAYHYTPDVSACFA